jgi:threonine synthase
MVELFHGPTFCFKDFGMQAVIHILSFFSNKRNKKIKLIVSTTGDTGPACAFAVSAAANPNLNLLVHFPKDQISAFQRKQMTTLNSPYVEVVSFEGGGDDMDLPIKNILKEKRNDFDFCGVNSYNIGRPLIQMIHFLWTYLRVAEQNQIELGDQNQPVDIIIPTGAMGNIAAAYMIKRCGVPIGKLCAGVNINDITDRVIQSGKFYKSERMEKTLSEAINIQVPYNFERLLYYLSDQNHNIVKSWMKAMEETTKLDLGETWLERLQNDFSSAKVTDDEMCKCIAKTREEYNYFIDPHTAVGLKAAEKLGYHLKGGRNCHNPFAIMCTASPCKFQESVTIAIGEEGWKEYQENKFPERAKYITEKAEINPIEYLLPDGMTLEEVHPLWENQARDLMVKEN